MTTTTAPAFTAADLKAAFLALNVRTIPIHDMRDLIVSGGVTEEDYITALDLVRRENKGRGFDVTVIRDGIRTDGQPKRHLVRIAR
jgi:hypothetical protein